MRRILSEWKMVQSQGLALGEGVDSAKGNSTDTFRLKTTAHLAWRVLHSVRPMQHFINRRVLHLISSSFSDGTRPENDGLYSLRFLTFGSSIVLPNGLISSGNMFEWHFTFLGARDTPFEGGLYHGSITLPSNYPQSGPSVRLLNKSQRFKVGSRICLSASEYHQETWQPTWTVTSLVSALVAHMTEPAVEIGSIQGATPSQKRAAAASSRSFECPVCGVRHDAFPVDRFPLPSGFISPRRAMPSLEAKDIGDSGGESDRRNEGVARVRGVGNLAHGVPPSTLRGRSRLSWTARLVASKPFLLTLLLILASFLMNQYR